MAITIKEIGREKVLSQIIVERDTIIESLVVEVEQLKRKNAELEKKLKAKEVPKNDDNTGN